MYDSKSTTNNIDLKDIARQSGGGDKYADGLVGGKYGNHKNLPALFSPDLTQKNSKSNSHHLTPS